MNRTQRRAANRKANKLANKEASRQPSTETPSLVERTLRQQSEPKLAPAQDPDFPQPGRPFPLLTEISPARLAANRENAEKSTGPVTEAGKAISSQNNFKHGLARHNGRFALLPTEDPGEFGLVLHNFNQEHQPETPTEEALVIALAESLWLRNRAQNLQPSCFDTNTGAICNEKQLSLLLRYENTYNRAFNSALNQLLKLRAEKRKAEIGFEAQRMAAEKLQMKKDAHYWDVLKKDAETCHQIGQNILQKMTAGDQISGFEAQLAAELNKHRSAAA